MIILEYTEILEVDLFAFTYKLFHEIFIKQSVGKSK